METTPKQKKGPGLSIAAFCVAILAWILYFVLAPGASSFEHILSPKPEEIDAYISGCWTAVIVGLVACVAALVLSIMGLKCKMKGFAITGMVLSIILLLLVGFKGCGINSEKETFQKLSGWENSLNEMTEKAKKSIDEIGDAAKDKMDEVGEEAKKELGE